MGVTIYYTTITASTKIDKIQNQIFNLLEGNHIPFKLVDVSTDKAFMENLRQKLGDPNALPPQIFNGDQYCGDFDAFFNAVENGSWRAFFKLDPTQNQK
ncbi:uncharacterized protein LOC103186182 [Callorhinchus milii]|uniref:SH3 domain-binding glutamic acid-rich-like protein 3 n=1 Tax=Callorhinchus milii TaxID=7868 RepID=K4GGZ2_CALMI|nr:uncharacterized protein LOC103186182 [Callorhinchus milii]AFM85456.1 SH3 domain-binding glutamic acid-rich-like protein 3 [Callorhinchus milii]AFM85474.1 SH3 domain-binding glutamic acid-rich-like protein 3 [Callorhinchus milii]AFM85514.1 SH3 domain-binding glutamic acid-rich-like protein 3 [Callorhinchus milii]AFM85587.1 SH3 domain-binding glutamic acid-rich-like protein 3 [Callorhinchus milii]AFM85602.1 SH3 domain-binding glutamic acid-rich-like protein 3 [Callorhinchus milii]|eukprot:gi/632973611/ref/XP_007903236.1/ PREDICTED: SH3 domain-binding glutamic acid-rich-like protein 3 [Callorhinchus milii]